MGNTIADTVKWSTRMLKYAANSHDNCLYVHVSHGLVKKGGFGEKCILMKIQDGHHHGDHLGFNTKMTNTFLFHIQPLS
jgi:hypothetical protein